MISSVLLMTAFIAVTNAGVIQTPQYPQFLNTYQPEVANIVANPSNVPLSYQYPYAYPSNFYPNFLPAQYQLAPANYPYMLAPLQYTPGIEEVALNEPVVYVEPIVRVPQPRVEAVVETKPEIEEKPHYLFAYSVVDSQTGDNKQHQESRDGDIVRGEYSLLESDGSIRKVEYIADPHKGFNAVVSRLKPKESETIKTGSH